MNTLGSNVNLRSKKKRRKKKERDMRFQYFEHLGFTSTDAGGRNSASAEHYRDGTQTEPGLQGLAPEMRELVCARQTSTNVTAFG